MSKPKGWLEKESYCSLQGPLAFLLPTGSPPFLSRSWSRQGLRLEEVHLSCLSKRRGSLGASGITELHLSETVKGNVGTLLLLPTLFSLRRRLQVEKSPVGADWELSTPEYLQGRNFVRFPAPRMPGAVLMLGSWLCLGICRLGLFANLLELNELSLTWARGARLEAGWQCTSRHRPAVVR